jgi:hypothetical protein
MNYLFNFNSSVFSPSGKVESAMTPEQVESHNKQTELLDLQLLKETGKGILYVSPDPARNGYGFLMSTWVGAIIAHSLLARKSWHNMAGKDGRLDVWFNWDGSNWHGINIGDNQILRVKRLKEKAGIRGGFAY